MPSLTYKDNDFRAPLIFHDEEGRRISNQLLKDSIFLKSHNIMDYSLIVGIVKIQQVRKQYDTYKTAIKRVRQNELLKSRQASMSSIKQDNQEQCENIKCPGLNPAVYESDGAYYIGIIDMLTEYSLSRKLQYYFKSMLRINDRHGVSSIPPEEYQKRFERRVIHRIIYNITPKESKDIKDKTKSIK